MKKHQTSLSSLNLFLLSRKHETLTFFKLTQNLSVGWRKFYCYLVFVGAGAALTLLLLTINLGASGPNKAS